MIATKPAPMRSDAERLALPTEIGAKRTPWWAWAMLVVGVPATFGVAYLIWLRGPLHPVPGLPLLAQIQRFTSPAATAAATTLLLVVAGGVMFFRLAFYAISVYRSPVRAKDDTAGVVDTAHMATIAEIREAGLIDAKCGDIIGYVVGADGKEIVLRWPGDTGRIAYGHQGAGKGVALVKPALLARAEHEDAATWDDDKRRTETYGREPLRVVLAIKPDVYESSAGFRERFTNVVVLDPFSRDPNAPHYNPLHLLRIGTPFYFGDCFWFGLAIVDQGAGLASFWDRTAHEAVAAMIGHCGYVSVRENNPKILSLPWLVEFCASFPDVDAMCDYILAYEHDPHEVFGWTERKHGKATSKTTKTCPWIASAIRALRGKAGPEKSGIFSSFMQFLSLYRDEEILAKNVCDSTFDIKDMANDLERSSTIYISMPASDLDRSRPYVRLLFATFFREVFRKTRTIRGREARGNAREVIWDIDEAAQLNRMEMIARYAGLMRGLGGKMNTYWQSPSQLVETYGRDESISANQGVHFYFRPETHKEAKPLSEELGQFSFALQHRNLSGERLALTKDHIAEQNQIQTRYHFTPFECKSLAEDEVFIFCKGLHIRAKQFRYYENEAMDRRSKIPWSGKSAVTVNVPKCIAALERQWGPEKLAILLSPAPDRYKEHREAAQVLENGCRVASWAETDEDTGVRSYWLQFWLPEPARFPIIDTAFESYKDRAKTLKETIKMFDERDKPAAPRAEPKPEEENEKPRVDPAEIEDSVSVFAESDLII